MILHQAKTHNGIIPLILLTLSIAHCAPADDHISSSDLYAQLSNWIEDSNTPTLGVLSTVGADKYSTGRTVIIRWINAQEGLTFVTHKDSSKVSQIENEKDVTLTLIKNNSIEMNVKGSAWPLSEEENQLHWDGLSKAEQARYLVIDQAQNNHSLSSMQLTDRMRRLSQSNQDLEKPESFIGYRIDPYNVKYTEYQPDKITDIITFKQIGANWQVTQSPPLW